MTKEKKQFKEVHVEIAENYSTYSRDELVQIMDKEIARATDAVSKIIFEVEHVERWYDYDDRASHSAKLTMKYQRLETDEEYNARIEEEAKRKRDQETRDRAELERLKKQFGV